MIDPPLGTVEQNLTYKFLSSDLVWTCWKMIDPPLGTAVKNLT